MEGSFVSVFGLGQFSACLAYGSRDVCSCVHVYVFFSYPLPASNLCFLTCSGGCKLTQSNQKAHIQIYDNKMIAQR